MDELSEIRWLIERTKIIEIIVKFANAMDEKDWQRLRTYLADEIDIDYSAFRGEAPKRITAEEYVQQRIDGLAGLLTLHMSTNHEVTIQQNGAQCKSAYRIYRLDPNREPGQAQLDTVGKYTHYLIKANGQWRINAIQQTVVIISGNPQVHGALRGTS